MPNQYQITEDQFINEVTDVDYQIAQVFVNESEPDAPSGAMAMTGLSGMVLPEDF